MRGLAGKPAIVTGAGGGIGRAIAVRLAAAGVPVGCLDLDPVTARATADAVIAAGGRALAHVCDITDAGQVDRAVQACEQALGHTVILVNCAGWDQARPFLDTDPAFWARVIDINYVGALHLHRAVLPGMVARGDGRVVNIASDAGRVGSSGESVYAGCKAALIAFGKTVARELATKGVRVNAVAPGPTDTALFEGFVKDMPGGDKLRDGLARAIPMKRLGQPEDVAGIVAFLASDEAGFITGQVISVSGGLTMHG